MNGTEPVVKVASAAGDIGAAAWNACANPTQCAEPNPFTRYEFFEACEKSGSATARTGWQPCHLALQDDGRVEAILPLYLKNHSQGEYVFDHSWADAFTRAGGSYYPKLQAAVPFTPATGQRFLIADGVDAGRSRQVLLAAAAQACSDFEASSTHITFMTEEEWNAAGAAGYLRRNDQQFHWLNNGYSDFDQFLGELSSSKRKNLRKERASVREAGVTFDWLTGSDLREEHWDVFFQFYTDTGNRKWGRPYLNREFFSRLGEGLADQILLILAKRNGRYIAGALNLFGEGILFGRNWGAVEHVPFLHFEACYYQAIDFAIARKFRKVEAGAQGAHKLLRGYMPTPTYSAHFIAHPGLRKAVSDYLDRERQAVADHIEELAEHAPFRKSDP